MIPPVHEVVLGDCVEVMATWDDESIDAIVTDPPYGLEFMGKDWDKIGGDAGRSKPGLGPRPTEWTAFGGDPFGGANPTCVTCGGRRRGAKVCSCDEPDWRVRGAAVVAQYGAAARAMQAWHEAWAREAFRVAKPGAYLLAFGGTRTVHRMTCAIEDAGWEIRDMLVWGYACLSEDTEVLTVSGWRPGLSVGEGDLVAAWDASTGTIRMEPVLETFRGPHAGPMVRVHHADTDQLLTPNHRVYHRAARRHMVAGRRTEWYEDPWEVREAAELASLRKFRVPLAGRHDGPGIGGEDYAALLGWVWTEGGFDPSGSGVRIYQSASANPTKVAMIDALLVRLGVEHKRYERERQYEARAGVAVASREVTWFISGAIAERIRADLPGKHPTYDLLWRMTQGEKRALQRAALLGDGHGYQFYQKDRDDLEWMQALGTVSGQRVKVGMRPDREGGAAYIAPNDSTEFQQRHRPTTEDYEGDVWCIRVSTGAFVARRSGMPFITGNSGFPKSLDVSKAIDKAAGIAGDERPVVGYEPKKNVHAGGQLPSGWENSKRDPFIREGVTDAAREWQGWGTALKPAWEPIVMARKPLRQTVAKNVLEYGTGALNIDGCRIPVGDEVIGAPQSDPGKRGGVVGTDLGISGASVEDFQAAQRASVERTQTLGRWPANIVLTDEIFGDASRFFLVPKAARSDREPVLGGPTSGDRAYGSGKGVKIRECLTCGDRTQSATKPYQPACGHGKWEWMDARPIARANSHPTVKPVELMRHLVRLVTPPDGLVLDPFTGSGSTLLASEKEGRRWVGIERDEDYVRIVNARLNGTQRGLGL